jgi:L-cysteine:1D-myo-inositol 2-amino-2-deoxy-alpha-D-glucopyranoside ligase
MGASGRSGNDRALNDVRVALDDDIDTPAALAAVDAAVDGGRRIDEAAALLGVSV